MADYVEHKGRIVPAVVFAPNEDRIPDCKVCGDVGLVRETLDDDRLDVMVKCWSCGKDKK